PLYVSRLSAPFQLDLRPPDFCGRRWARHCSPTSAGGQTQAADRCRGRGGQAHEVPDPACRCQRGLSGGDVCMNQSALSKALPASELLPDDLIAVEQTPPRRQPLRPTKARSRLRFARAAVGWLWRLLVGAVFCLNYFASILVVGWTYRLVQGRVLRGWWKASP